MEGCKVILTLLLIGLVASTHAATIYGITISAIKIYLDREDGSPIIELSGPKTNNADKNEVYGPGYTPSYKNEAYGPGYTPSYNNEAYGPGYTPSYNNEAYGPGYTPSYNNEAYTSS